MATATDFAYAKEQAEAHYDKLMGLRNKAVGELLKRIEKEDLKIPQTREGFSNITGILANVTDDVIIKLLEAIQKLRVSSALMVMYEFIALSESKDLNLEAGDMQETIDGVYTLLVRRLGDSTGLLENYRRNLFDGEKKREVRNELIDRGLMRGRKE